ncbi:YihY/virulence factor BrkB family protein [Roseivivax isoporae]|uniref:Ribonuclease BN n=1 Tax=Roseivivax isoporae LMG 25204 TaxID=1449351 RepID=X7FCP7_9RHOB|nr:YihY/virulence factor BrkB family protein [Roseivivax isoporae]ETX30677.1 ribonuclease BN [Roseivivax isoporae LMG 25204]
MSETTADMPDRDAAPAAEKRRWRWYRVLRDVATDTVEDNISVVAAGVAFYTLLSIFPAATAMISLAGYVLDPSDLTAQLEQLVDILPQDAATIIQDQVLEVTGGDQTATGLAAMLALALAVYGAMRGVKTLMSGMNIAYGERERRGFFTLNVVAVMLTVVLLVGVILALNVVIVIPAVMAFLGISLGLEVLLSLIKWIVMSGMTVLGLSFLYRFAPSRRRPRWRMVSPGALIAGALWIAGTMGFSLYVQNFGSYNETYGTLGGVIILLTWLWLSAFIVLLGAEFNAHIEGNKTRRDEGGTIGQDRPAGDTQTRTGATLATAPDP